MRLKYFCLALLLAISCIASSSSAALQLSSLTNPTLQTLIDMGSVPVVVGSYQFSDFGFVDASTGVSRTASQVQVQAFTSNGYGLQFVANWFTANGSIIDDVVSYDVQATTPSQAITKISLLSNGTAPVPATGTFTSVTLLSSVPGGATAAPLLSTYNDGFTVPIDSTKPDVNYVLQSVVPQLQLHIIDTLFAISTAPAAAGAGGVATASVLQNSFFPASIPEPSQPAWIVLSMAVVICSSDRSWRKRARA